MLLGATQAAKIESVSTSTAISASDSQIQNTVGEAIKSEEQSEEQAETKVDQQANSKLGFLEKVISLECFFGGSDCLFKDKKSLKAGKITEFAQK